MKDPTSPQVSNDRMRKAGKDAAAKPKKKSSSVGIFVTVVCIVIVFACLIPIFFGGSFFGSEDSGKSATKSQVANGDALVFNDDEKLQADGGLLPDAVPGGVDAEIVKKETEHSVTLSGKELEQIEGGANNSGYPRGVGGSVNQATAQVPVLRRSDNFNHIKAGSGSATTAIDVPPVSQMHGPVPQQMPQQMAQQRPQQMAQQMTQQLAQPQVAPKPMVQPQNQVAQGIARDTAALEAAAQKKLKADREAAAKAQAQAQANAQNQTAQAQNQTAQAQKPPAPVAPKPVVPQRQPLKAGQVISLADEQRQLKQLQAAQAQASRPAAQNTAASAESKAKISALNGNHWTVQIVSASNRANVAAAARGLTTPWWIVDSSRNGRPWYILISGDYATREEAIAASRNIPLSVSQGATPFAKRISEAKAELR